MVVNSIRKNKYINASTRGSAKLPAILSISLVLIFMQMAGAFYSKSLTLFAYAIFIFINIFYLLLKFASGDSANSGFKKAQVTSIILNASVLFILSLVIIIKALSGLIVPKPVNTPIVVVCSFIVGVGFLSCAFVEKSFILTFILIALLGFFIALGFLIFFRKVLFLDYYLSMFFAVLIMIQIIFLIRTAVKLLREEV